MPGFKSELTLSKSIARKWGACATLGIIMAVNTSPAFAAENTAPVTTSVAQTETTTAKVQVATQKAIKQTKTATKDVWKIATTDRPQSRTSIAAKHKIKRVTRRGTKSWNAALRWTDKTMSRPALVVMVAFLLLVGLLGLASATDRTGNYH